MVKNGYGTRQSTRQHLPRGYKSWHSQFPLFLVAQNSTHELYNRVYATMIVGTAVLTSFSVYLDSNAKKSVARAMAGAAWRARSMERGR